MLKLLIKKLPVIIINILIIFPLITGVSGGTVYAAAETLGYEYTDVLEDLDKDKGFNPADYTEIANDYSLDIITIAESENKELFIYVYQPSGQGKDLRASSINISTETGEDLSFYNYGLRYINSIGVFYKYIVKGFTVSDSDARYYSITSIYRPFDDEIDDQADYDNTITEVNFNISKQYTINSDGSIGVMEIETVVITDENKFVGYVQYPSGWQGVYNACNSHFVAFATDRQIDQLIEADVYYASQYHSWNYDNGFLPPSETFGEKIEKYAYLSADDKEIVYTGNGLFAGTYTWNTIQTVEEFITEVESDVTVYYGAVYDVVAGYELDDVGRAALQNMDWVLRFTQTDYSLAESSGWNTIIADVTILRLKFESMGKVYNLGVVDNKKTGNDNPINIPTGLELRLKFWVIAVAIIAVLILIYFIYNSFKGSRSNKET